MGAVYKAEDIQFGDRLVAVKEMRQTGLDPQVLKEAADAFKQEAVLLAGLKHPSLPSIYDHFSENGRWYLVMDFIEGETLAEHLNKAKEKVLPVPEVLDIGIQLSKVLGYLHTRTPNPVIFRDLSPSNVMFTPDGHVYLIDFGIARFFKPGQAKDTIPYGKTGYASPEQYGRAQTTPQSDIFSLGATLHEMLSGNDPSNNTPNPYTFPPLPKVPAELERLIEQMLQMDTTNRPASIADVKQELEQIADQRRHPPVPPTTPVPPTIPAPPPVSSGLRAVYHATPVPPTIPAPPPAPVPQNKEISWQEVVKGLIGLVVVGVIVLAATHFSSLTPSPPSPTPVPTLELTIPPTPPSIQGIYSGSYQLPGSSSPILLTLDINQQNHHLFSTQDNFGGTCTQGSTDFPIQNGTVDTNGNIQFSITGMDANGNNVTRTFTGTAQSGGGWQGNFSDTDNNQGPWSVVPH